MANSNDEDDYMSDAILAACNDTRPGLMSDKVVREMKVAARHKELCKKNRIKPVKVLEKEKREEGLNTTLDAGNKGFAMLQKMGFKPGMSLGKQGTGRLEPVPIQVKTGRGGLGREVFQKRKNEERLVMRAHMAQKRARHEERHRQDFRKRFSEKMGDKQVEQDLLKSQKVCGELDAQKGLTEPVQTFYWPPYLLPQKEKSDKEEEEEEEEEEEDEESEEEVEEPDCPQHTTSEMLEILTQYLRSTYVYCVWCGTSYNDEEDLTTNCPGPTSDAHD